MLLSLAHIQEQLQMNYYESLKKIGTILMQYILNDIGNEINDIFTIFPVFWTILK